jgi:F-type H+-transporting ATPase subunit gamma
VFVVAADKGLCGGFNNNTCRKALDYMRAQPQCSFTIFAAGRKAVDFFKRINRPALVEYTHITMQNVQKMAAEISQEIIKKFQSEILSECVIIYNELKSAIRQIVVVRELFPVKIPAAHKPRPVDWLLEPDRDTILRSLIPQYVESRVYQALVESYASESAARMNAMDNASKNAQDLIENFTLVMNKMRQAQITRELTEIVGTSEALK